MTDVSNVLVGIVNVCGHKAHVSELNFNIRVFIILCDRHHISFHINNNQLYLYSYVQNTTFATKFKLSDPLLINNVQTYVNDIVWQHGQYNQCQLL